MMRMGVGVAAVGVAFILLDSNAVAQARADFSGRWTTEPEAAANDAGAAAERAGRGAGRASASNDDMGSGWGPTITITQSAETLMVEYMFFTRGDMQPPLRFVYALDGSATTNTVMMGRGIQEQKSTTMWDGDRLIITTLHSFPDPGGDGLMTSEVKQVLSLESPVSLMIETTRSGVLGGPSSTTRTAYRKL